MIKIKDIRVLIVEDVSSDVELAIRAISKAGIILEYKVVETEREFKKELKEFKPDIILSDYSLPDFDGMKALNLTKELAPELPFIIFTGSMNEETAVECMKAGADDYIIKNAIKRLPYAIIAAIEQKQIFVERRNVMAALQESEKRFRTYIENAPDGIFIVDNEGKFFEVNKSGVCNIGYTEEELKQLTINDILAEESKEDGLAHFKKVFNKGKASSELLHKRKDGKKRWWDVDAVKLSETRILGFVKDITKRKLADIAIRESEELYSSIFENTGNATMIVDENTIILHVNEECYLSTGYTSKQLIGTSWTKYVVQESLEIMKKYNQLRLKEPSKAPKSYEVQLINAKGEIRDTILTIGTIQSTKKIVVSIMDITERKTAEKAYRESEEKYRILIENAMESIMVVQDGVFKFINPITSKLSGYSKEELYLMSMTDFIHPDDVEMVVKRHQNRLKGEDAPNNYNFRIICKNKTIKWVDVNAVLIQWEGKPATLNFISDVTERKLAEIAIRDSENELKAIYENAPLLLMLLDKDRRVRKTNNYALRFCKSKETEVIGKRGGEAMNCLYSLKSKEGCGGAPECADCKVRTTISETLETQKNQYSIEVNLPFDVCGKRTEIYFLLSTTYLNILEEPMVLVSVMDITEKKVAEQQIKQSYIVQSTLNSILKFSIKEIPFNDFLERTLKLILDVPSLSLLSKGGIFLQDANTGVYTLKVHKGFNNHVLNECSKLTVGKCICGKALFKKDIVFVDKINELHDVNYKGMTPHGHYCVPIMASGKTLGLINLYLKEGHIRNNQEEEFLLAIADTLAGVIIHKETQEQLVIAKNEAQEGDRLKTAFLSNMSHEIRTPMNAILGFSQLLSETTERATQETYVEYINTAGHHLMNIITDIIDIAKIEAKQEKIRIEKFNLNELIDNVHSFFKSQKYNKELRLIVEKELPDYKAEIIGDPVKLKQVLTNLIGNAIKFTEEGRVKAEYYIENDKIVFKVKDTGIGMSEEDLAVIFERFRQVDMSSTRKYGGTGLGLSISKSYVEMMGGKISVESELGVGSEFTFEIPYKSLDEINKNRRVMTKENLSKIDWTSKSILYAEDEDYNIILMQELLKKTGVKLYIAKNGLEAVELCKRQKKIDLILMDMKMPVMGGIEATQIIKSTNKKLPIIALTAYALSEDKQKYTDVGCDNYLAKPINISSLISIIKSYFN